jgi:hypothetical protein
LLRVSEFARYRALATIHKALFLSLWAILLTMQDLLLIL